MVPFLPVIFIMLSAFSVTFWIYDMAIHEANHDEEEEEEFTKSLFY
jgi:hypothetical protein